MKQQALIIFTKAPVAGAVKTRLIPALGADGAAALHKKLIVSCLDNAIAPQQWDSYLWCAPDPSHPLFQTVAQQYPLQLRQQTGVDLGARMFNAFESLATTYQRMVIVGTDCPQISVDHIKDVFAALKNDVDAVITPAEDGGYVLMGLTRVPAILFKNIAWGSSQVMQQTRVALRDAGLRWQELGLFWDIDRPEDLRRYEMELKSSLSE